MKQKELDLIAKAIRNQTTIPFGYRETLLYAINKALREENMFFNSDRFLDIGLTQLPDEIRNDTKIRVHRDFFSKKRAAGK